MAKKCNNLQYYLRYDFPWKRDYIFENKLAIAYDIIRETLIEKEKEWTVEDRNLFWIYTLNHKKSLDDLGLYCVTKNRYFKVLVKDLLDSILPFGKQYQSEDYGVKGRYACFLYRWYKDGAVIHNGCTIIEFSRREKIPYTQACALSRRSVDSRLGWTAERLFF